MEINQQAFKRGKSGSSNASSGKYSTPFGGNPTDAPIVIRDFHIQTIWMYLSSGNLSRGKTNQNHGHPLWSFFQVMDSNYHLTTVFSHRSTIHGGQEP